VLRQFLVGGGVSICNIVIHALVMTAVVQVAQWIATRGAAHHTLLLIFVMVATVSILMAAHAAEVMDVRGYQPPRLCRHAASAVRESRHRLACRRVETRQPQDHGADHRAPQRQGRPRDRDWKFRRHTGRDCGLELWNSRGVGIAAGGALGRRAK
jgi:hypothetical protein